MITHLLAISIAFILDAIIGDPPHWPHPVKWMGSGIAFLEKRLNKGHSQRAKGVFMLILLLLIVLILSITLVWLAYQLHYFIGLMFEGLLIFTTIARKSLKDAALDVYHPLVEGNLDAARLKLSYIVGRDTEHLGEGEIVRGTVETVAENTSDGVTAPLFWAFIGGAPLAMAYRMINTCDSMVGYKNDRFREFGWASARLDDVMNWLPSRLTGLLIVLGHTPAYGTKKEAWRILFRDAKKHPSPNSGWLEAGVAGILGVELGGVNSYGGMVSERARMGNAVFPLQRKHIDKTNQILLNTSLYFILTLWMGGILFELANTWSKSTLFI